MSAFLSENYVRDSSSQFMNLSATNVYFILYNVALKNSNEILLENHVFVIC